MVRHIHKKLKTLWKLKKAKYPNGVGIYDLYNNLIKSFDYASELAIIYINLRLLWVNILIKDWCSRVNTT